MLNNKPFLRVIFFTLALSSLISCKKNQLGTNTTLTDPATTYKPGEDMPHLFFSYESTISDKGGNLACTNVGSYNYNTNFNLAQFPTPRPVFHTYVPGTNELWGTRRVGGPYSKKSHLIKFSLTNKTFEEKQIFPTDGLIRHFLKVDELKQQIYYLEGNAGNQGFTSLKVCKFDGSDAKILYEDKVYPNDIISAIFVTQDKFYYHSLTFAALMELDIVSKKAQVRIPNFYPASAYRFTGFKEVTKNNIQYWQPQYKTKSFLDKKLMSYDVDPSTKIIYWISYPMGLIKKVNGEDNNEKYNKLAPVLIVRGINNSIVSNYGTGFAGPLTPKKDRYECKILSNASLKVDTKSHKLYIGLEELQNSGSTYGQFEGEFYSGLSQFRKFKIIRSDYNGQNPVSLLKSNGKNYNYPLYWNTQSTNQLIPWEKELGPLFSSGPFDSFVFANLKEEVQ